MRRRRRYKLTKPANRALRVLITLGFAPVLVLSPLTANAVLIHYDGHDVHAHTVAFSGIGNGVEIPDHPHASHGLDCHVHHPHEHDGSTFLIVLHLPDAVRRMRGLGSGVFVAASSTVAPSPVAVADALQGTVICGCPTSLASALRPDRTVVGILLSNHALLL